MVRKHLNKKYLLHSLILVFFGALILVNAENSYAATNWSDTLVQKALLTDLYRCYTSGQISTTINSLATFNGKASSIASGLQTVPMPSGYTSFTTNKGLTCDKLIGGGDGFEGLLSTGSNSGLSGKTGLGTTKEGKITLLQNMGYEDAGPVNTAQRDNCIYFTYKENDRDVDTDNICAAIDSDGKISHFSISHETASYEGRPSTADDYHYFFETTDDGENIRFARATITENDYDGSGGSTIYAQTSKGVGYTWDEFVEDIKQVALKKANEFKYTATSPSWISDKVYRYTLGQHTLNGLVTLDDTSGDRKFQFMTPTPAELNRDVTSVQRAAEQAISYVSGGQYRSLSGLAFSSEEQLTYYKHVLTDYYFGGISTDSYWYCNASDWSNYNLGNSKDLQLSPWNTKSDCKIDISKATDQFKQFTGIYKPENSNLYLFGSADAGLTTLIDLLNQLASSLEEDYTLTDDPDQKDPVQSTTDPNNPTASTKDKSEITATCMKSSSADSLSWVVCPAIGGLAEGSDGLYGLIKDMLAVKPELLSSDGSGSSTFQIWEYFRNFANVIFAILLLAVIFSQVTGFGIDNYGIKKILPRLIVTAILVNLSYFICQLAVDVSNIVGNAATTMLSSWANSVSPGSTGVSAMSIVEAIFSAAAAGTSAIAPFATTVVITLGVHWWIILIIVGLLLIAILLAALIAFLMLGARQILVVVAVVVAPVAFVCYTLPNTEKLYKKWVDILKVALLVFPICSLLSGMGQVIQAIVFGASKDAISLPMAMVAAACPFIPFFALPSLLKGSLRAVGDLGNKISSLGTRTANAAKRANSAIRNTDGFKDAQFQTAMKRNSARLERFKNADGTWKDDSKLTAGQRRRKSLYQRRDIAYRKEDMDRDIMSRGGYEANLEAQKASADKQMLDNEIVRMATETSNYNVGTMNSQLKGLIDKSKRGEALSDGEKLRMKALTQKLSTSGGFANKELAATAREAGGEAQSIMATMMSKNADVSAAISGKDSLVAQYLREINEGNINARGKTFDQWKNTTRVDEKGQAITDANGNAMSNKKFVATKVVTKDANFIGQSASVAQEMLNAKEADGSYSLSDERLSRMINNERLMDSADDDVKQAIIQAAKSRGGIAIPSKYSGSKTTPQPANPPASPQGSPQPRTATGVPSPSSSGSSIPGGDGTLPLGGRIHSTASPQTPKIILAPGNASMEDLRKIAADPNAPTSTGAATPPSPSAGTPQDNTPSAPDDSDNSNPSTSPTPPSPSSNPSGPGHSNYFGDSSTFGHFGSNGINMRSNIPSTSGTAGSSSGSIDYDTSGHSGGSSDSSNPGPSD